MNWSEDEVDIAVDAYFEMRELELASKPYVKAEFARRVCAATGRSKGSVEFKFANISAVLRDADAAWIFGYKPRSNYQQSLSASVMRRLADLRVTTGDSGHPAGLDGASESVVAAGAVAHVGAVGVRTFEDGLRSVPERAYGGAAVAARPSDWPPDPFWVQGLPAPGADEVLRWMKESIPKTGDQLFTFLVGGPGNGKSYLTARFVDGMEEVEAADDGLAQRSYRYDIGDRTLVLVNDATISRADDERYALTADIADAIATGSHLLANVNRGILYEELGSGRDSPAEVIMAWLEDATCAGEGGGFVVAPYFNEGYVRVARVDLGNEDSIWVTAVFMDTCSLFEARPEISGFSADQAEGMAVGRYTIKRLRDRDSSYSNLSSAGSLLAGFIESFPRVREDGVSAVDTRNVFMANVLSLSAPQVQAGICRILRAAEIASSRRMTYRELWGAISLLIVGEQPERWPNVDAVEWLESAAPPDSSLLGELNAYTELAGMRFHQALFRARPYGGTAHAPLRPSPVTRLTALVDPVRDALPGDALADRGGWADPVLRAFSEHSLGVSPLESLIDVLPETDPLLSAVTEFDRALDEVVAKALASRELKDTAKRALTSWYGQYLTRLYATANGIPAFFRELDIWSQVWGAAFSGASLPEAVEQSLLTLLLPPFAPEDENSEFVLPSFDARATPLTGRADEPRVAVTLKPWQWELRCRAIGDQIGLQLVEQHDPVVEIDLDFAVLREALASEQRHVGISEYTHLASPRLERFRATLLRPGSAHHVRHVAAVESQLLKLDVGAG